MTIFCRWSLYNSYILKKNCICWSF